MRPQHVYRYDPPYWLVGYLNEDGIFAPLSKHDSPREAAQRAASLNSGGQDFNETSTQERTQ